MFLKACKTLVSRSSQHTVFNTQKEKNLNSVVNFFLCFHPLFLSFLCPVLLMQGASMYFPPAEGTAASQSFPSSMTPHTESNPPPFAPLTSLLPYRIHNLSAWARPAGFNQKTTKKHIQKEQKAINSFIFFISIDVVRKGKSTSCRNLKILLCLLLL